jgi:hypothetical protein
MYVDRRSISLVVLLVFAAFAAFVGSAHAEDSAALLHAVEQEEGVLLAEGDDKILFYQRTPKSLDGRWERAGYVHPLYDLDGNVLSEDFPEDHRHHRGIFWAWHQILVGDQPAGDGWAIADIGWEVTDVKPLPKLPDAAGIQATVVWKSNRLQSEDGAPLPVVKEVTTIRAHRAAKDVRLIDFEIRLHALVDELRLGGSEDEKGYGGFSTRVRLPKDVLFISRKGKLEPQVGAVEGGPWLDCVASYTDDGRPSGVAILSHPSLPAFPQPWILRSSRSMQNPMYPGREAVAIPRDKPLVLRYRLAVHRGDTAHADIEALQREYEAVEFE